MKSKKNPLKTQDKSSIMKNVCVPKKKEGG